MAKTKTGKVKKRIMSAAQKAALAKGRRALAEYRKRKSSGVKQKRKSPAATTEKTAVVFSKPTKVERKTRKAGGQTMTKKATKTMKRASSRARGFIKRAGAVQSIQDAGLAIAGGVAAGLISNKLPIQDARIKAGFPIIAGILLAGTLGTKNKTVRGVANGMIVLGTVGLFKQLAPNVPMIAGENTYYLPTNRYGYLPSYAGESVDLSGNVSLGEEYFSPANM